MSDSPPPEPGPFEPGPPDPAAPRPLVGITTDLADAPRGPAASCALRYALAVAEAGGTPLFLPPLPELAPEHARLCGAFVFTGGDDPRTEPFGEPTHPLATPMHPQRQTYETALLRLLRDRLPERPVLGVCLGMQLMALHAGGRLDQHLPDTLPSAERHRNAHHEIRVGPLPGPTRGLLAPGSVASHHRQAVRDPGSLLVVATAEDGVIEAVLDPARPFYLGVQWHPERTPERHLGQDLFTSLIAAALDAARPRAD